MTLIDGDKIITAQLYDDEHEEFIEQKMSIIEYVNAYTDEGVTRADDVLDKIRVEIMDFEEELFHRPNTDYSDYAAVRHCVEIIDKYKAESEE